MANLHSPEEIALIQQHAVELYDTLEEFYQRHTRLYILAERDFLDKVSALLHNCRIKNVQQN